MWILVCAILLVVVIVVLVMNQKPKPNTENEQERIKRLWKNEFEKLQTDIVYGADSDEASRLKHWQEVEELRGTGVEKFQILGVCDRKTCKTCAQLDGKIFDVADAEIGVNVPPFCDKCRCSIVGVVDRGSDRMRSVRDENGRHITVPYITYEEWSKKYAPDKYEEYFLN